MLILKTVMIKTASWGTTALRESSFILAMAPKRTQGVTFLVSFLLAFAVAGPAFAKKREFDWLNFSGFYSQYTKAGGGAFPTPAPSADIDLALRLFSKLSLTGTISNTVEPDPTDSNIAQYRIRTTGGGLKLDLPGFFFLGGEWKELKKPAKNWPVSTFLMADVLNLTLIDVTNAEETSYLAGRYALGLDIFPFTDLSHFTLKFSYLSFANAGYFIYSFGGGISF